MESETFMLCIKRAIRRRIEQPRPILKITALGKYEEIHNEYYVEKIINDCHPLKPIQPKIEMVKNSTEMKVNKKEKKNDLKEEVKEIKEKKPKQKKEKKVKKNEKKEKKQKKSFSMKNIFKVFIHPWKSSNKNKKK